MSGVCDAAQRGRRVNIFSRVFIPLGFLITAVSLIALNTVNAAIGSFKVADAVITAQSAGVGASIGGFDETRITSDVTFYHLNDSVTYNIELQNTGENAVTISSISDNNASPYLTYNYSTHAGEEIAAGGTLSLEVEVVYSAAVAEITARSQSLEIEFTINCVEDDEIVVPNTGETSDSESAAVPDTGAVAASSGAKVDFAPLIVAIVGAVLLVAGLYKSKLSNKTKIIALALAGSLTIVSAVNASSKDFSFTFASDFEIKSILAINYNDGVNDVTAVIPYGSTLEDELEEPEVEGYIFYDWLDENDDPFDPTAPITDDITIHPDLKPIQYTVAIDTDDDGDVDQTIDAEYDEPITLPNNESTKPGHTPNGWTDGTNHYDDGEEVENLTTEDGDTINLVPDYITNQYTVNIDTDNDGQADQSLDVTYGQPANLPDNDGEKPGYTPNGWTDGTNHYNDGADVGELAIENGGSITISADWSPISYALYIDINDNDEYEYVVELKYNESFTLPTVDRSKWRWGLAHSGWVDGGEEWGPEDDVRYAAGQVVQGLTTEQDGVVILGTTWVSRILTISWEDINDEEFLSGVPDEVSYDDFKNNGWKIPLSGIPRKEGHRFVGWEVNGDGPYDSLIAVFPEDDDIYVAKAVWEKKKVSVCYGAGASIYETQGEYICDSEEYGTTDYTIRHNYFTRNGYLPIDGWSVSGSNGAKAYDGGQSLDINAVISYCDSQQQTSCSMNLAALWTPRQTTIHFSPGEGVMDAAGGPEDAVFTYGEQVKFSNIAIYQRPGFRQTGWVCGSDTSPYALTALVEWKYYETDELTCTAKWTANWYRINFNKNASDATGGMSGMSGVTYGDSTPLTQNSFSRNGYRFIGWRWNNTGNLIQDGAPAGQFPVEQEATVELYAQWEEAVAGPVTFDDAYSAAGKTKVTRLADNLQYYTLQDMNSNICNAVSMSTQGDYSDTQEAQVLDVRDQKVYWIAKLLDGKCWMTQNLDHDIVTTEGYYTHENTDLGWGSDTETTAWAPIRGTIDAVSNYNGGQIRGYSYRSSENAVQPYSVDTGDWYWIGSYYSVGSGASDTLYDYLNPSWSGEEFKQTPFATNGTHGHVGNLYNWAAAIASNDASSYAITSNQTIVSSENSICPAGWRLPTGTQTIVAANEYANLLLQYENDVELRESTVLLQETDSKMMSNPLYFVRSGKIESSNSRFWGSGTYGQYWTSTSFNNGSALGLYQSSSDGHMLTPNESRGRAFAVRCVAR